MLLDYAPAFLIGGRDEYNPSIGKEYAYIVKKFIIVDSSCLLISMTLAFNFRNLQEVCLLLLF